MLTIELKTNFAEFAETMDLFIETKKVLASYNAEKSVLEERKTYLESSIKQLQENHAQITIEAETFKSEVGSYLAAQLQLKEIKMEIEVMNVLVEELNEELQQLKLQFFPQFDKSLNTDRANASKIDINPIMQKVKDDLLDTVVELSVKMNQQFTEIAPEIFAITNDEQVQAQFPHKQHVFHQDQYRPAFGSANETLISKWDVFKAVGGNK